MITSLVVEMVELAQLDHSSPWQTSGPKFSQYSGTEAGDGRHQEPRQVSAVTLSEGDSDGPVSNPSYSWGVEQYAGSTQVVRMRVACG
jgi:hypothetical protein